jgi:two-component system, LuxR family, response regulator FixJ
VAVNRWVKKQKPRYERDERKLGDAKRREPTVFIVDDNRSVCRSYRELLQSAGLKVQTFASCREFLDAYDSAQPGCLVLEVLLRAENGLDLQDELKRRGATLPVIVITGYATVASSVRALKAGAFDFLCKPVPPAVLLPRVREAIAVDRSRREDAAAGVAVRRRFGQLTSRQREIVHLIVGGMVSREIAAQLGLSVRTVEGHRWAIFSKMGVTSAAQLVSAVLSLREPTAVTGEATSEMQCVAAENRMRA